MTTSYQQIRKAQEIPKLEAGKTYKIVNVDIDSIEYQNQELARAIFGLEGGARVSALGSVVVKQAQRMSADYFESVPTSEQEPIVAMAKQEKGQAKESKGHNPYWVLVDPTTGKAL